MLRKVETTDALDVPFSVIEVGETGIIVDIPASPIFDESGEVIGAINPEEYGVAASWADVMSPFFFDMRIGDRVYSWDGKPGTHKIALTPAGLIGLVRYVPFRINSHLSNIRKVIAPSFEPLAIRDGVLSVNGDTSKSAKFKEAKTGEEFTLGEVAFLRDGEFVRFAGVEFIPADEETRQIEE
jgi:hypothetical protein